MSRLAIDRRSMALAAIATDEESGDDERTNKDDWDDYTNGYLCICRDATFATAWLLVRSAVICAT